MGNQSTPVECRRARGLTLIELMVVVAVLAILATIAVPMYERYTRGAARADGKAALTAIALAQERVFSVYQRYVALSSLDDWAGLDPEIAAGNSPKLKYDVSLSSITPTRFTAVAVPHNRTDPECGTLQINAAGIKSISGGSKDATYCW